VRSVSFPCSAVGRDADGACYASHPGATAVLVHTWCDSCTGAHLVRQLYWCTPGATAVLVHTWCDSCTGALVHTWLQVAAEALRVCEQVILVLRPRTGTDLAPVPADLKELVPQLFNALRGRLAAPDQVCPCVCEGLCDSAQVRECVCTCKRDSGHPRHPQSPTCTPVCCTL